MSTNQSLGPASTAGSNIRPNTSFLQTSLPQSSKTASDVGLFGSRARARGHEQGTTSQNGGCSGFQGPNQGGRNIGSPGSSQSGASSGFPGPGPVSGRGRGRGMVKNDGFPGSNQILRSFTGSQRYLRRPRSPVLPGNYVPNKLVKEGYQLGLNETEKKLVKAQAEGESCPWLEEEFDPKAPPPRVTRFPVLQKLELTPPPSPESTFKLYTNSTKKKIHLESVQSILKSQVQFESTQRKEIDASLYAHSTGDDPNVSKMPFEKRFIVIDFGTYRLNANVTMPAEFTIADFSVVDGINSCYSRLLDPVTIPLGLQAEVRYEMAKNGYLAPGFDDRFQWGRDCFNHIEIVMKKYKSVGDEPGFLYVMPENFIKVKQCLLTIAKGIGRQFRFKLMPFPVLIHILLIEATHLANVNRLVSARAAITELEVAKFLMKSENDGDMAVACSFHQLPSRVHLADRCTSTSVKCRIYNALDLLTRYYRVPRFLYNHFPKIEELEYLSEPKLNKPMENDERKEDSCSKFENDMSKSFDVRTNEGIYRARGASTISSVASLIYSRRNKEVEMEKDENFSTMRKTFSTLEAFPALETLNTGMQRLGIGFEFKNIPDKEGKDFPKNPNPHFTITGEVVEVTNPECTKCYQDPCICDVSSISSVYDMKGTYKRFGNPTDPKNKWKLMRVEKGEKGENISLYDIWVPEENKDHLGLEREYADAEKSDSIRNFNPPSASKKTKKLDYLRVMKEWQKLLPTTGSAGRGMPSWAGERCKLLWDSEIGLRNPGKVEEVCLHSSRAPSSIYSSEPSVRSFAMGRGGERSVLQVEPSVVGIDFDDNVGGTDPEVDEDQSQVETYDFYDSDPEVDENQKQVETFDFYDSDTEVDENQKQVETFDFYESDSEVDEGQNQEKANDFPDTNPGKKERESHVIKVLHYLNTDSEEVEVHSLEKGVKFYETSEKEYDPKEGQTQKNSPFKSMYTASFGDNSSGTHSPLTFKMAAQLGKSCQGNLLQDKIKDTAASDFLFSKPGNMSPELESECDHSEVDIDDI